MRLWRHYQVQKAEVINTVLFVSGINTLLQSLFGSRLPVVIGASYAYVIPALYITFSYRFTYYLHPHVVKWQPTSSFSLKTFESLVLKINVIDTEIWGDNESNSRSSHHCCYISHGHGFLWLVENLGQVRKKDKELVLYNYLCDK